MQGKKLYRKQKNIATIMCYPLPKEVISKIVTFRNLTPVSSFKIKLKINIY